MVGHSKTIGRSINVSAPGKVILFGEHSVVYGKHAVAFSVNLRTNLLMKPCDVLKLNFPKISVQREFKLEELDILWDQLKTAKQNSSSTPTSFNETRSEILKYFLQIDPECELSKEDLGLLAFLHLFTSILDRPLLFSITVESQIPVGSGLGSSAAYAVCLAAAFLKITDKLTYIENETEGVSSLESDATEKPSILSKESRTLISNWAFECEKILHGTPSGIDNAICTFGGAVSFKQGSVQPLHLPALKILLVNTQVPRNTKKLVSDVRNKLDKYPSVIQSVLTTMDEITKSATEMLTEIHSTNEQVLLEANNSKTRGNLIETMTSLEVKLHELVDMNQCMLETLGVSHPSLRRMVSISRKLGFSSKLTGAGGGGFGFVMVPLYPPKSSTCAIDNIQTCKTLLNAESFEIWETDIGGAGVTITCVDELLVSDELVKI